MRVHRTRKWASCCLSSVPVTVGKSTYAQSPGFDANGQVGMGRRGRGMRGIIQDIQWSYFSRDKPVEGA